MTTPIKIYSNKNIYKTFFFSLSKVGKRLYIVHVNQDNKYLAYVSYALSKSQRSQNTALLPTYLVNHSQSQYEAKFMYNRAV